jgi:hypothetical protein
MCQTVMLIKLYFTKKVLRSKTSATFCQRKHLAFSGIPALKAVLILCNFKSEKLLIKPNKTVQA